MKAKLKIEFKNDGIDCELLGTNTDLVQILTDSAMQNEDINEIIKVTYNAILFNERRNQELN